MANQDLLDYIRQQKQQGVSEEQIRSSLMDVGWQVQDIDEALSFILNSVSQSLPVLPPAQIISSLPGAAAILGQAWAIYRQRLGIFLGIMAIPMLIMIVFVAAFIGGGALISKFAAGGIGLFILLVILFFIIIFVSQVWGFTALLYAIKDNQERIGVLESYRKGWRRMLSYGWVSLLIVFITIGGFLLLIVPGIIFAIQFSLAGFILIAEDLKGMNALLKSKEYVKGNWGGVLWRLSFMGVMSSIISLVPIIIFSLLKIPFGLEISRLVIGLFLTPLAATYSFLVYSNLKDLKGEIAFVPTVGKKAAFIFVGILGILLLFIPPIVLIGLNSAREKGRDAKRQSDIEQIRFGLEMYNGAHNNKYPFSLNELSPNYLRIAPVDPSTNQPYQYQSQLNGADYQVCAQLESTKTQKCITSQSQ